MSNEIGSEALDLDSLNDSVIMQGILSKWTNYVYGWQDRFITLKHGQLSYFKNESEEDFDCRGIISAKTAKVKCYELDDLRFDVSVNDCIWHLRAATVEEKQRWIDAMDLVKCESGFGSENSLRSSDSIIHSKSEDGHGGTLSKKLHTKINKLEAYRDSLIDQIVYFEKMIEKRNESNDNSNDLKKELEKLQNNLLTVVETLNQCLDLINLDESLIWSNDKNQQQLEDKIALLKLQDEKFFDATETSSDEKQLITNPNYKYDHKLWSEIEQVCQEQIRLAHFDVSEMDNGWKLFAIEGEMRMYRREEEANGMVVDPLKACHVVHGVTGREICNYFFRPEFRYDWETTLEKMTVVENISNDTIVFRQIHKKIWPASQRDALFWSHLMQFPDDQNKDGPPIWAVVNHSTDHPKYPANANKLVRVFLTVCLMCQTHIKPLKDGQKITRDDISCQITYCSVVNPGGWAPAIALRAVYKREYPKFLKRFTSYVIKQCQNKEISF